MSFAGLHAIRSALSNNNTYAALPIITTGLSSTVVGRVRFDSPAELEWPPVWNITAVGDPGSNLYTVSWKSDPISITGDGLVVSFLPPSPAANFSIEPAGDNLVRFHVPNVDSVWTLADDGTASPGVGTPVTLEADTGLMGQRWTLEDVD